MEAYMKRLVMASVILALIIFTISGCSNPSPSATAPVSTPAAQGVTPTQVKQTTPAKPQPVYGGVFREVSRTGTTNIGDPAVNPTSPWPYAPVGESLYFCDQQGNPTPCLATSWDFDPNGKYVIFHLRKGVKFHDGTDFNAQAAKICLDRGKNGQAPGLKPVTSFEVVDDYTLKVNWPSYNFSVWDSLGCLKGPSRMISPTAMQAHDATWLLTNPVATGPFKLTAFNKDVSIVYDKNNDYWQKGQPYLDRVVFNIIADPLTALMSFKAGEQDMIRELTIRDAKDLKAEGKFNIVQVPGYSDYLEPSGQNPNSPFSNVDVRRAVCYALDTKTLADSFGQGYYTPANQTYPDWNWANNKDIKGYPYDPAKGKQLLAQAGFPNGFKTKLFYSNGYPQDLFLMIQSYLKVIGIDVELAPLTATALSDMTTKSGWDGLYYYEQNSIIGMDPGAAMQNMGFVNRGAFQISVARYEEVTTLLEQANATSDQDKRKALLQQMGQLITDKYCMICPIYYTQSLNAVNPAVHDIGLDQFARTYGIAWLSK
jgi:peptide/nickel transport system substrate-binding protein